MFRLCVFAQEKARWDAEPFSSLAKWPRHVTATSGNKNNDDNARSSEESTTKLVHKPVLLCCKQYLNYF
jgi:hypothetical protein